MVLASPVPSAWFAMTLVAGLGCRQPKPPESMATPPSGVGLDLPVDLHGRTENQGEGRKREIKKGKQIALGTRNDPGEDPFQRSSPSQVSPYTPTADESGYLSRPTTSIGEDSDRQKIHTMGSAGAERRRRRKEKSRARHRAEVGGSSPYIKLGLASDNHDECPILQSQMEGKKTKTPSQRTKNSGSNRNPAKRPGFPSTPRVQGSESIRMGKSRWVCVLCLSHLSPRPDPPP